jgi:RimJ/RimL family protein N-acetyltransferase
MTRRRSALDTPILRPATVADGRMLFDWRNDEITRANSRDGGIVSWEAHRAWLDMVLADPTRELLIAEIADTPVGTVRLDRLATEVELSWTVAPEHRDQGIGRAMVAVAVVRCPGVRLRARILHTNRASMAIAQAAGFRLDDERDAMTSWVRD